MTYESTEFVNAAAAVRDDFRRSERLVVLIGAAALGIFIGLSAALIFGRVGIWPVAVGAPVYVFALYLAVATLRDAIDRRGFGCAAAAGMAALSMLAWPASALVVPMSALAFWIAPFAVLGSMILLASCWSGAPRAIYRLSGEAALFCVIVGFLGIAQVMG